MATWNQNDFQAAQAAQLAAANDPSGVIRLVAGPGTGKSFSIEQKVANLLQAGIQPGAIYAVSYTRAAANDLKLRIESFCQRQGIAVGGIRASTVHSLALRTLRAAGVLAAQYPADPIVLDNWEVENIFDKEFGHINRLGKIRTAEIRQYHEAFWSTGNQNHPSYIPPATPISAQEQQQFNTFKTPRTSLYSCVLPGEIVQLVVQRANTGTLNPQQLLDVTHLIVDEFQDLNPMDMQFMDILVASGVQLFASGDDDQSIYSFRFGSPEGIRRLPTNHPRCGQHMLAHCFRCTPNVLQAAQQLMTAYADQNRIPKTYVSMYGTSTPAVPGVCHRWIFGTHKAEARGIADSCQSLIQAGLSPSDILILVSNKRLQLKHIEDELLAKNISFESPSQPSIQDTPDGRWLVSLLRLICNNDDYIALRTLWGERTGVGMAQTIALADWIRTNHQNYKNVFFQQLALTGLTGRTLTSIQSLRTVTNGINGWTGTDTLAAKYQDIGNVLSTSMGANAATLWANATVGLSPNAELSEVRDYLWAETDEQRQRVLEAVSTRLNLPAPTQTVQPKVKIMTMHGSKGLSAKVVFIPGLEEQVLPGPNRALATGLVQEAARLLYVAITRAKASCILSLARRRSVNGTMVAHAASQFTTQTGGVFAARTSGLSTTEVTQIITDIRCL